uniref:THAP-type domain-containing protein n=1 Tax=Parastrongyloides trichosuri TaxID=131310 RepID=A0A0N5A278_PARTI
MNITPFPNYASNIEEEYISKDEIFEILRTNIPQCYICLRTQSNKVRLFKWPRVEEKRKMWCDFFQIDEHEIIADFANTFICSLHFEPKQFIYKDNKIFWTSNVFPLIVDPIEENVGIYPWEEEENTKNIQEEHLNELLICATKKFIDKSVISISFRDSNFRPTGKIRKHPVAIVKDIRYPSFYYEFSHNRTSSNGTNFYYCLSCRKMKDKTGIKDNIRTISIKNGKVTTSAHPFTRHHSHCSPTIEEFNFDTYIESNSQEIHENNKNPVSFWSDETDGMMTKKFDIQNISSYNNEEQTICSDKEIQNSLNSHEFSESLSMPLNKLKKVPKKRKCLCKNLFRRKYFLKSNCKRKRTIFCCICLRKFRTVPELTLHLTERHQ